MSEKPVLPIIPKGVVDSWDREIPVTENQINQGIEVVCYKCENEEICKFREQHIAFIAELADTKVLFLDGAYVRLADIPWIKRPYIGCKYIRYKGE